MLNCILFCVLLAGIGACYVWLGIRKRDLADQIYGMDKEIREIKQLIREKEGQINRRLSPEDLRTRTSEQHSGLKPIDIGPKGRLYRLPEPDPAAEPVPPLETAGFTGSATP